MDWDECLESDTSPEKNNLNPPKEKIDLGLFIVIDTNVLITDLQLVRSLIEVKFKDEKQRPQLMIPYVVLQELDNQKQRRVQPISSQAQHAIKYIHERLKIKDKLLQGKENCFFSLIK